MSIDIRAALSGLISYVEGNECQHEDTHRGGAIWTICDGCGRKWADDRGGFKPYQEPKELTAAIAALDSLVAEPEVEAIDPPMCPKCGDGIHPNLGCDDVAALRYGPAVRNADDEARLHADDARAAMAALIIVRCDPGDVARNSYNYADALRAERKRRQG